MITSFFMAIGIVGFVLLVIGFAAKVVEPIVDWLERHGRI